MRRFYRYVAFALSSLAVGAALAQAPGANPAARGGRDSFSFGATQGMPRADPLMGPRISASNPNLGIGRPVSPAAPHVTPVPEPSQWMMLLAGLVVVGFIARRNASR